MLRRAAMRTLHRWALAALLSSAALAREARAQADAPAAARRSPSGFYLRTASGFGAFDERLSAGEGTLGGRNRGLATLGELALGGTLAPGWVIGGGIYAADLLASTYRGKSTPPAELDPGLRSVALLAAFADHAFERLPELHIQFGLGLATLTPRVFGDAVTNRSDYLALGAGLMLGGGYEFPVSESWRIGVLARTTICVLGGRDEARTRWLHVVTTSPGLLLSLTYQ
jgi:hypothetical protein